MDSQIETELEKSWGKVSKAVASKKKLKPLTPPIKKGDFVEETDGVGESAINTPSTPTKCTSRNLVKIKLEPARDDLVEPTKPYVYVTTRCRVSRLVRVLHLRLEEDSKTLEETSNWFFRKKNSTKIRPCDGLFLTIEGRLCPLGIETLGELISPEKMNKMIKNPEDEYITVKYNIESVFG
jgi:hypothetical protein